MKVKSKIQLVLWTLLLVVAFPFYASSASAYSLDQAQEGINYGFWFDDTVIRWQEFKTAHTSLARIDLYIGKNGSPGNLRVAVKNGAEVLLWETTVAGDDIAGLGWIEIPVTPSIPIEAGHSYFIHVWSDADSLNADNRYFWRGQTESDYDQGISSVEDSWPGYDFAFRTWTKGIALYGVNSGDDGLSRIDSVTGEVTFIGPLDPNPNRFVTPVAMAIRPSDSTIFVWNNSDGEHGEIPTGVLLTVDPATGLATEVDPSTSNQGSLGALAFGPNETLYGVQYALYEVNTTTGEKTSIGSLGSGLRVLGADFSAGGILYGITFSKKLVKIDTGTGTAYDIVDLSEDIGTPGSIAFDPETGTLVGSGFSGAEVNILFDIDISSGEVSNIRHVSGSSTPQGMGFIQLSTITGQVMYNGTPVTDYTHEPVSFWARDENTGQGFPISPHYNTTEGTYSIPNVPPGKYGISIRIDDAEPFDGRSFPGDYYGWNSPIVVTAGQPVVNKDLVCEKIMHLTSPIDNLSEIGSIPPPYDLFYENEILFKWDTIVEASTYQIRIVRYQSSPYQYIENVYIDTITNTQVAAVLGDSLENQHYELELYARNTGGLIVGRLMVVYDNGYGWDYRFRVLYCDEPCEGDFDHDGDVDGSDLAVFATDFGRTDCCKPGAERCEGDFNNDGDVDGSDLAAFAADFGRTACLP